MDGFGTEGSGAAGVLIFAVGILMLVSGWKLFAKAGKPGWAIIVPIYNVIVMLQIVNRPLWWILLMLIPVVNIVVGIVVVIDLAKSFGKSGLYALGLVLLSVIFYPMLAFGGALYTEPQRA
jgi:TctA family transporter